MVVPLDTDCSTATAAGGVVSGGVAAALTAALGEAYVAVMVAIAKGEMKEGDLKTEKGKKFLAETFKNALKLKRNEKGERHRIRKTRLYS